jgi:pyruvate dehydrogenase E1 component alpha subunit
VREVALEAIERARRGDGPTLIEAETYRFRGHSLADPDELRSKEEKAAYAARDPIPQLKAFMLSQGLATEDDLKAIHDKCVALVVCVCWGGGGGYGAVCCGCCVALRCAPTRHAPP